MSPTTITIKGGIYLSPYPGYNGAPDLVFLAGPLKSFNEYEAVVEHTIEATLPPEVDCRSLRVQSLERERTKARADFQATMTRIEREIGKLLAIEDHTS